MFILLLCFAFSLLLFFFFCVLFFFHATATTEIYTLSLHDALPIFLPLRFACRDRCRRKAWRRIQWRLVRARGECWLRPLRSEEHTSELQSLRHLVCRLLLEKKKKKHK